MRQHSERMGCHPSGYSVVIKPETSMVLCPQLEDYKSQVGWQKSGLIYNTPNNFLLEACVLPAVQVHTRLAKVLVPKGGILFLGATARVPSATRNGCHQGILCSLCPGACR